MKFTPYALLLAVAFAASGCYHTRIETGMTPGAQVIDQPFAHSFINGLVPPSTVNAASQCPNGVAVVETELSFVNGIVAILTSGIYTPMHIKVTCAAAGSSSADQETIEVAAGSTFQQATDAVAAAASAAVETGSPVLVHFAAQP